MIRRPSRRLFPAALIVLAAIPLAGCGAVSGAASLAGTAVDVAGTVVETSAKIVTAPIR